MAKNRDDKKTDKLNRPETEDLDALDEIFKDDVNLDEEAVEIVDDEGAVEIVDEDEPAGSPKGKPAANDDEDVLDAVEVTDGEQPSSLDNLFTDAEETEEVAEVEEAVEVDEDNIFADEATPVAEAAEEEEAIAEEVLDDEEAVAAAEEIAAEDEELAEAVEEAEEVAEIDEDEVEEAEPVAKAASEDDIDLNEIFGGTEEAEEADEVAEIADEAEEVEEAEPVAEAAAVSGDEVDLNELFDETEEKVEEAAEVEEVAEEVAEEIAEEDEELVEEVAEAAEEGDELIEEAEPVAKTVASEDDVDLQGIFDETEDAEEAAEVAEAEEAAEVVDEVEEDMEVAAPVGKAVSEDDVDLNELFGEDEAREEAKVVSEEEEEAEPVAKRGASFDDEEEAEVAEIEAEDEEEGELVGAGAPSGKSERAERRPGFMGRWGGGLILGLLVGAAGVGGTWFAKPELLPELAGVAPAPVKPQDPPPPVGNPMDDPAVKAALEQLQGEKQKLEGDKQTLQKGQSSLQQQLADAQQREKKLQAALATAPKTGGVDPALLAKAEGERKKAEAYQIQAEAEVNRLAKALKEAQLAQGNKADPAFAKTLKELNDAKDALTAVNKRLKEANVQMNDKGVEMLITAIKEAEKKVTDNQALADAKVKEVEELVEARKKVQAERDELDMTIKAAIKELAAAKLAPAGADAKALVAAVKAASKQTPPPPPSALAQLEQKLDLWLAVLSDRGHNNPNDLTTAVHEASMLQSPKASPETRAKAMAVTGLAYRNEGRFTEALQALQAASAEVKANKLAGTWAAGLSRAMQEVANPADYFMPRIEQFMASRNVQGAVGEITAAIKASPGDGRLHVLRARLRLDAEGSKLTKETAAKILEDIDAASKDPRAAAEMAYVHGRLQELSGNLEEAEKSYRRALQSHKGSADEAARYRIALARLLQRERTFGGPVVAPPPRKIEAEPKKEVEAPKVGRRATESFFSPFLVLAIAAPQDDARLQESIDLAKDLIKSTDAKIRAEGHMLLGTALAKQGRRTEGLKEYIRGLEILTPGASAQALSKMVEEHPAFQQPDTLARPNPSLAEHHFGRGLHYYWNTQYGPAEEQFKQAVSYFKEDARYQYFLGLAQLAQKTKLKRDAAFHAFEQGARLEAMNRPPHSDINASLERLQGELRQTLNSFRHKK